jgi:integrase
MSRPARPGTFACSAKAERNRTTPLKAETACVLREWLDERQGNPNDPVFPTRQGRPLSQDAITKLLAKHTAKSAGRCPSLAGNRVTPHVLRHYVDGWVMWPAGVFPLLGLSPSPVPAT